MDLLEVNERYGSFIWAMACRYHTGAWSEEDVAQSVLIQLHSAITNKKVNKFDELEVKGFVITKAIDIVRYEVRRQQCKKGGRIEKAPQSVEERELEISLIRDLLYERLEPHIAGFIFELAFPCSETIQIAHEEWERHVADTSGKLHMFTSEMTITSRHVQLYYEKQGVNISRATVSRYKSLAREALSDLYNPRNTIAETQKDSTVDSILEGALA